MVRVAENHNVALALEAVRKMGLADGKEHLIALSEDGEFKFLVHGDNHSVGFENEDTSDVAYIIHNHPNGAAALSSQDIGMITAKKLGTVMNTTPTGSVFKSRGMKGDTEEERMKNAITLHNLEQYLSQELNLGVYIGKYQLHVHPDMMVSHFANIIARERGILDYEFKLSEEDEEIYRKHNDFFNKRYGSPVNLLK